MQVYLFRFKRDYAGTNKAYDSWEEIVVSNRKITAGDAQQIVANMCPPEANGGEKVEVFELEARVVHFPQWTSDTQAMVSAGCMGMYPTDAGVLVAKLKKTYHGDQWVT